MRIYDISLTAGGISNQAISGNFFRVLTAGDPIKVRFDGSGVETELLEGLGLKLPEFHSIAILSEVAQSIKIIAGFGEVEDNRTAGTISLDGSAKSYYGAVSIGATATLIKAANSSRRSIAIQPIDGDIYVASDSNVTTANGLKVTQGGSITIENMLAVYGISDGPTVDVRYSEDENA